MQRKGPERPRGASGAGYLYAEQRERVIALLLRLGVHEDDAPDVLHEVFATYARREAEGASIKSPADYLRQIARRHAANYRRLHRWRIEVATSPGRIEEAPDPSPSPEARAALAQWCDRAERLPPVERAALRLHLEGYSIDEIARRLETSRATAWKRLTSARKALASRKVRHENPRKPHR
ncbi:sigma-70 family RNA polymerase sigma factor [Polyangium sp. 6x1]|uniref:RNA polymerase sigma factor n=1 Tax=Polyangium sp. 6x1 TaxID=3042689 RepID=UPI002482A0C7|nr:sigma-70 family RNA polymerase sigma factor [Polyangium sp. 6x1]MDI1449343.1 sigma-70 family RNA polymerase sigma factor [Polyangium sp. 6x1]